MKPGDVLGEGTAYVTYLSTAKDHQRHGTALAMQGDRGGHSEE